MEKEKYLVVNAGSSSLKFSLYEMPAQEELVNVYVEKIGSKDCFWTLKMNGEKIKKNAPLKDHSEAVEKMMQELIDNKLIENINEIKGVGHRVLHGGEFYAESVKIDDEVLSNIESIIDLGPLHLPPAINVIKYMQTIMSKDVPQVAVFDTAFHQSMPKESYIYPVPYEWYEKYGVRKYGFHGTSYRYITKTMEEKLNKKTVNLIICHIGSGASIAAVKDSKCFNTTMGLTPLAGLMMGTRSGDIDPSILEYICKKTNMTIKEATNILNKESGLKGISGENDFRDVEELMSKGDEKATLAFEMIKNSIVKFISQYYIELDGEVDGIVFTAGAGENDIDLRREVVKKLKPLGIILDEEANDNIAKFRTQKSGLITTPESKVPAYVEPTDEESVILMDTYTIAKNN
ncbi:MAG: acetate kinase [bacterium]|nr:acetate kinase [bacterium]